MRAFAATPLVEPAEIQYDNERIANYTAARLEALRAAAQQHAVDQLQRLKDIQSNLEPLLNNTEVGSVYFYSLQINSSIENYQGIEKQLQKAEFNKNWCTDETNPHTFKPGLCNKLLSAQNPIAKLLIEEKKAVAQSVFTDTKNDANLIRNTKSYVKRAATFAVGAVGALVGLACTVLFAACAAVSTVFALFRPEGFRLVAGLAGLTLVSAEITGLMGKKMFSAFDTDSEKEAKANKASADITSLNTKVGLFKTEAETKERTGLDSAPRRSI